MEELKKICDEYTYKRDRLVKLAQQLFEKRKGYVNTICTIAEELENISGLPKWCEESTNEWFENIRDFQTAVKYENDPQKFEELTIESGRAAAYWGCPQFVPREWDGNEEVACKVVAEPRAHGGAHLCDGGVVCSDVRLCRGQRRAGVQRDGCGGVFC